MFGVGTSLSILGYSFDLVHIILLCLVRLRRRKVSLNRNFLVLLLITLIFVLIRFCATCGHILMPFDIKIHTVH